ncbi:MAG: GIY-YIG nuclease family protein [Plectolyngbya sp. WJT66-NPBG17]|jgi:hypothetical protein|nr:GIY-YIG nuclease family protein [Plectolyngbya sp. WJT66-NPBG17]
MKNLDPDDINRLPAVAIEDAGLLPSLPAVYFVIANERILYIGKALNLQQRWKNHHRWGEIFALGVAARLHWLEFNDALLIQLLEQCFINYFDPPMNNTPVVEHKNNLLKPITQEQAVSILGTPVATFYRYCKDLKIKNKQIISESDLTRLQDMRRLYQEGYNRDAVLSLLGVKSIGLSDL